MNQNFILYGMQASLYTGKARAYMRRNRIPGALSLGVYLVGFSLAYLTLDAGLGALILFGVVQME